MFDAYVGGGPGGVKFCGFEIEASQGGLRVSQASYAAELCGRHQLDVGRPTPMSTSTANLVAQVSVEKESTDLALVRQAQAITGEVLWLSIRTRPDIAYPVGVMGRLATRSPSTTIQLGQEVIAYLYETRNIGLIYGRCEAQRDHGAEGRLPLARSMMQIERFADISFAPQGGGSIQGMVGTYGGAPIQWESNRQTCCALSTAEAELFGYVEATVVAANLECIVALLEEVEVNDPWLTGGEEESTEGKIQKIVYGDNSAAIAILCSPDGPWRTRHLRMRSQALREKLKVDPTWKVKHLPGELLVAGFLTKTINPKSRWTNFYQFMQMADSPVEDSEPEGVKNEEIRSELAKIAVAGVELLSLAGLRPERKELKVVRDVGIAALSAFMAVKTMAVKSSRRAAVEKSSRIKAMRMLPLGAVQGLEPGTDRRNNVARIVKTRWSNARVDMHMDSVGDEEYGDYWEYFPHRGLLRRHHVHPRQELFGHLPAAHGPWEVAPVEKERLLVRRRTTILTLNQISDVFHIHDGWNFDQPEDQRRPTICDEPWVGFTDFALPAVEPLEFLPPFDPHSMLSEPGSDDGDGDDGQEEDDDEGPSTGGSTTPQTSQEVEAPQSIEDDDRTSWLTCGTTMWRAVTGGEADQGQGRSPSSSEESDERLELRPSLKVFLHRRDGDGDGEEREDRRRERSRSRDDEDVRPEAEQSRDEVPSSENAGGQASSSREDGGAGIGSAERTRRNVETADLDASIPADDMVHVPAEWVAGIEDSIERLLDAERLPEENQRRRAQRNNDVVRRALHRLGVLEGGSAERGPEAAREPSGTRDGDDRRGGEGDEVPYNPNYMDEIMAAEREEMEESLEDLIQRGLVSVDTAERVRNTADIVSQGGRCPAATLEAVDLDPREGIARMDIVVRGPVSGHAAYHVMGRARTDVSRCIHNNPDVEVVGGLPPHMTVEMMSTQEAQRLSLPTVRRVPDV